MLIRERIEEEERQRLSQYAALSGDSRGRELPEVECDVRTVYQRDRDRIIHSKAFRRLMHKTQVFFSPYDDHFRTRLTHTLEVSQISRTAARALGLNEDLTEAIALGHDLGHTPFGHSGEHALDQVCRFGFKHNLQSVRVVTYLETRSKHYSGLNLTMETLDGIAGHTGDSIPFTLEGQLVRIADRIAYINHDIDDAIRAGILDQSEIPEDLLSKLGRRHSERISTMVSDIIEQSGGQDRIHMSNKINESVLELREFLFEKVYRCSQVKAEAAKAEDVTIKLFDFYMNNPQILKEESDWDVEYIKSDPERAVCDWIAGMTDRYALAVYAKYFIPRHWGRL